MRPCIVSEDGGGQIIVHLAVLVSILIIIVIIKVDPNAILMRIAVGIGWVHRAGRKWMGENWSGRGFGGLIQGCGKILIFFRGLVRPCEIGGVGVKG